MSEVQSRPSAPRGRSSARGGRAGYGSRGGRGGRAHTTNGTHTEVAPIESIENEDEVGHLKKEYGSKVGMIKEMFPDWTDEDAVFALQETNGDLETTVERITDGSITQWGEVSKNKKDRSRSKAAKDTITTNHGETSNGPRASRGRGAHEGGRGVRSRGSERGRGGRGRGAAVSQTNSTRTKDTPEISVPTEESPAWDAAPNGTSDSWDPAKPADTWGAAAANAASSAATAAAQVTSSIIPDGAKKSWASIFKPTPAPAPVPKKEPVLSEKEPESKVVPHVEEPPTEPVPAVDDTPLTSESSLEQGQKTPVGLHVSEADHPITPSKDELTETNLEQLPDTSNPAPTATAASTVASSWDPRSGATSATPYSSLQQQQPSAIRPPTSGFAASAQKAAGVSSGRIPSYQRRVLDQEEAVRMPGNRDVDRAAVQFGAFNLGDDDVDGDREEPETRAQPPQHSPVAQPRASLPPAPLPSTGLPASLPSPKEASGLPTAHPAAAPGLPSPPSQPNAQNMSQQGSQGNHPYNQYARYGQAGGQDASAFGQKPYDPFSQQATSTQSQYPGYPGQQGQTQSEQQPNAFSSAPSDYSSYYTADQQRNAYQNYYGQQYGQQQGANAQQEVGGSQQRVGSGFNASHADSASPYPQSSGQQGQSRFGASGEIQTSGQTTPAPPSQGQQQPGQGVQSHQGHASQPQAQPGQYPYGHPYYSSPYYAAYMNQYQQGFGQGSYGGAPYGGKGGMYNQPHGYGMSPQAPYDHAASPAAGSFGQASLHGRETALGGGIDNYGRAGSQPSQTSQPLGGVGAFGGMNDAFGRGSSYQGQGQHYGQQAGQQGAGEDLKPFGDGKSANGPSPLLSQAARPTSATNSAPGQSGLPPPQSSQQGYGGYPSHLQQQHALHGSQSASQYGGLGGGHQAGQGHQASQYGAYGQGFGGNSYYGNNQQRGGGWGNNYGH
ncbi:MAG: hypothetical protein M1818_005220 [Claussenomyces sp. TS43310]|nr:MAG: hypothetical protein M1818_005220 [Claussenomyces sp. TS43310]